MSDELAGKIEDLKMGMQDLQIEYRAQGSRGPTPSEVDLIRCAKEIMRSGKTLCEESLAGDCMQGGEGAARINRLVAEWAGDVESLRRDTLRSGFSDADTRAPTTFSDRDSPSSTTARTTAVDDVDEEVLNKEVEDDDELDDDFLLEIAQAAFEQGKQSFEKKDWREAEILLKEALTDLKRLPSRRRADFDVFELEYKLTVCAYHTREPAVAKEALMNLVGQTPTSDGQKCRIYDAAHLLAQLHLRENELEPARMTCESTLRARSKIPGKTHDSYLESLALMAHIYTLLGNDPRARVFMGIIPTDRRTELLESLQITPIDTPAAVTGCASIDSNTEILEFDPLPSTQSVPKAIGSLASPATERSSSEDALVHAHAARNLSRESIIAGDPPKADDLGGAADFRAARPSESLTIVVSAESGVVRSGSAIHPAIHPYANSSATPKSVRADVVAGWNYPPNGAIERAICEEELKLARSLISEADHKTRASNPRALTMAVHFGDTEIAVMLIKHRWDVNALIIGPRNKFLPIVSAMAQCRPEMVRLLLASGAELAPLPRSRYDGIWRLPISYVINPYKTIAGEVKKHSDMISCITQALDNGWGIDNDTAVSSSVDRHGPLLWDVITHESMHINARCALIEFLMERGASPLMRKCPEGPHRPVLNFVIRANRPEVLPLLLAHESKPQLLKQKPWADGCTEDALCQAVRLAAMKAYSVLNVQALLDAGADVASKNDLRSSLLPKTLRKTLLLKQSQLSMLLRIKDPEVVVRPYEIAMASDNAELKALFENTGIPQRKGQT